MPLVLYPLLFKQLFQPLTLTNQDYHELQNELRFQMREGPAGSPQGGHEDAYYRGQEDPYGMGNSGPIY